MFKLMNVHIWFSFFVEVLDNWDDTQMLNFLTFTSWWLIFHDNSERKYGLVDRGTNGIKRNRKSFDMPLPIVCRIIFSAHKYTFYDHVHLDRTREITVPAMSWNARDDPGFVIATFQKTGRAVSISYCSLARESHILLVYISMIVLFCFVCLKG